MSIRFEIIGLKVEIIFFMTSLKIYYNVLLHFARKKFIFFLDHKFSLDKKIWVAMSCREKFLKKGRTKGGYEAKEKYFFDVINTLSCALFEMYLTMELP